MVFIEIICLQCITISFTSIVRSQTKSQLDLRADFADLADIQYSIRSKDISTAYLLRESDTGLLYTRHVRYLNGDPVYHVVKQKLGKLFDIFFDCSPRS